MQRLGQKSEEGRGPETERQDPPALLQRRVQELGPVAGESREGAAVAVVVVVGGVGQAADPGASAQQLRAVAGVARHGPEHRHAGGVEEQAVGACEQRQGGKGSVHVL